MNLKLHSNKALNYFKMPEGKVKELTPTKNLFELGIMKNTHYIHYVTTAN